MQLWGCQYSGRGTKKCHFLINGLCVLSRLFVIYISSYFQYSSSNIKVGNHLHSNRIIFYMSIFYFSRKPKMSSRKQIKIFKINFSKNVSVATQIMLMRNTKKMKRDLVPTTKNGRKRKNEEEKKTHRQIKQYVTKRERSAYTHLFTYMAK